MSNMNNLHDIMDIDDIGEIVCEMSNKEERLRELLHRCLDVIPDGEEILIDDLRRELFCE